ncbi:hypothetical protein [Ancylobacter mangrovi]|uniref:hypothetical protein n=1 Tax=Ancylobacter mangrovi TaxID=2972472 RepID=UPI0021628390|nr:hypothetical protein [Ancylobacter mangrovi]MCS0501357.1 hypothetical protein [Ancylobacter mangrovi]
MAGITRDNVFKPNRSKTEAKAEAVSRTAMGIVEQEAKSRAAKMARLREARLARDAAEPGEPSEPSDVKRRVAAPRVRTGRGRGAREAG